MFSFAQSAVWFLWSTGQPENRVLYGARNEKIGAGKEIGVNYSTAFTCFLNNFRVTLDSSAMTHVQPIHSVPVSYATSNQADFFKAHPPPVARNRKGRMGL